jgi:hypothetical protein
LLTYILGKYKIAISKSDQDYRIMDMEILCSEDKILVYVASSAGQYHCIQTLTDNYDFETISTIDSFDSAQLCIKALSLSEIVSCSNKGIVTMINQTSDAEIVQSFNSHQVGINVIDAYENYIVTGSDDQHLNLYTYENNKLTQIFATYAHHSSIKALRFFTLEISGQNKPFLISSSYDQRGCIWALAHQKLTLVTSFKHTLPDIFD